MMNSLDKNIKYFYHHYQKITIMKELQKIFGEMYLEGGWGGPFLLMDSLLLQI